MGEANLNESAGEALEPVVNCVTKTCDVCGETWESSFFSEKHSGWQHFDGEMVLEPNYMWEGSPNDEYVWVDREPEYMDICLNCCMD